MFRVTHCVGSGFRILAGAENDEIFPNANIEHWFNTVRVAMAAKQLSKRRMIQVTLVMGGAGVLKSRVRSQRTANRITSQRTERCRLSDKKNLPPDQRRPIT